jgi:hypothetical protein
LDRAGAAGGTGIQRLSISDVRSALNLPDLPYAKWLSSECWLAGGILTRWLSGEMPERHPADGDFDFYFPSQKALRETASEMLKSGYVYRRDLTRRRTFGDLVRWKMGRSLEELPHQGAAEMPSIAARQMSNSKNLLGVEFSSPEGDCIQLVTFVTEAGAEPASPFELIADFDFSICQFAMDDRYLYAGPCAWGDLMRKQLRVERIGYPPVTMWRAYKYLKRGFRPYFKTALKIVLAGLLWRAGVNRSRFDQ